MAEIIVPAERLFTSSSELEEVFRSITLVHYNKSQSIIYKGDEVKRLYYIKSGYVKVYNINDDGEERILILRSPGDIFPLLKDPDKPSYISDYFYDTMTTAEIGSFDQKTFLDITADNPDSAWQLLRYLSDFSTKLTSRLSQIENKTAEGKLEKLICYLAEVCGKKQLNGDTKLDLKLTHQDLASLLGVARETVSREIPALFKKYSIKTDSGRIIIPEATLNELTSS